MTRSENDRSSSVLFFSCLFALDDRENNMCFPMKSDLLAIRDVCVRSFIQQNLHILSVFDSFSRKTVKREKDVDE
jgi:hypothetical protein